jgi:hypothetical protein
MDSLIIATIAVIVPVVIFGVSSLATFLKEYYDIEHKKHASWRPLTTTHQLKFVPSKLFEGSYITGQYRGHLFKIDTTYSWRTTFTHTFIQLAPATGNDPGHDLDQALDPAEAVKNITPLLSPNLSPAMLRRGEIEIMDHGQRFYHECSDVVTSRSYLEFVIDLMSNLAEAYPALVQLGGEIVPSLAAVAQTHDHPLQRVAKQLLDDIEQQTTLKYGDQPSRFMCPHCLTCYAPHPVHLSNWTGTTYYGCRICGQSREYLETAQGWVVAVLDNGAAVEQTLPDGILRINWPAHAKVFDFDEIEIIRATDEDVERFAVMVGNDTDPVRQSYYKQLRCSIAPGCLLSENTHRILQRMFGQVSVQEELKTQGDDILQAESELTGLRSTYRKSISSTKKA